MELQWGRKVDRTSFWPGEWEWEGRQRLTGHAICGFKVGVTCASGCII